MTLIVTADKNVGLDILVKVCTPLGIYNSALIDGVASKSNIIKVLLL